MIYIDMDDVVADTGVLLADYANRCFNTNYTVNDMTDFDLKVSFKLSDDDYYTFMTGFHHNCLVDIAPIDGAVDTIKKWNRLGYDPAIVTGRPTYANGYTLQWLKKHGLEDIRVYHVDKYNRLFNKNEDPLITPFNALHDMDVKFAIDDSLTSLNLLTDSKLCPFAVFTRPWNSSFEASADATPPSFRASTWAELESLVPKYI